MSLLSQAQAYNQSDIVQDLTNPTSGGGERRVLPEGTALVRLSGYIEYGTQLVQKFGSDATEPKRVFRLVFKIVGGQGTNEAGERVPFKDGDFFPTLSTWDIAMSTHEKSKAVKMFAIMNYKKTARHFSGLMGELFFVDINHETKNGKTVARPDWKTLSKPVDRMTGQLYDAPALPDDMYQLFLWDNPTPEQWASIFIEGTTDEGKSKNYIQDQILKAQDFEGSRLEAMLNGVELPVLTADAEPAEKVEADDPPFDVEQSDVPEV